MFRTLLVATFLISLVACNKGYQFRKAPPKPLAKPAPTTTTTTTSSSTTTTTSTRTTTTRTTTTSTTTTSTSTTTTRSTTTTSSSSTTTTSTSTTTTTTVVTRQARVTYNYEKTRLSFQQDVFDANRTTTLFKAFDRDGINVADLKPSDIRVTENGVVVNNFTLKGNDVRGDYDVDIVISMDVTGSMKKTINSLKNALRNFISQLEARGINAHLCSVTFKDQVEKICDRFIENDPSTPENENLIAFLDELTKMKAEGGDLPTENSLAGLIAAAEKTPWHPNAQRVIIHFTDMDFYIMPHDKNIPEARYAPYYIDVKNAMLNFKPLVFPVTKKVHLYASDWFGHPSVPKLTGGKFFELKKIESGSVTMDEVLDQIGKSLVTQYQVEYESEQNPGLDPTLPLSQRNIKVELLPSTRATQLRENGVSSNMPNGRPEYKKVFKIADRPEVNANTLDVYINGQRLSSGYRLAGVNLVFDLPPAPGAHIVVEFEMGRLRDNVLVQALPLQGSGLLIDSKVWYNGQRAPLSDYDISPDLSGQYVFEPKDSVFAESDPYMIRNFKLLDVVIEYTRER